MDLVGIVSVQHAVEVGFVDEASICYSVPHGLVVENIETGVQVWCLELGGGCVKARTICAGFELILLRDTCRDIYGPTNHRTILGARSFLLLTKKMATSRCTQWAALTI